MQKGVRRGVGRYVGEVCVHTSPCHASIHTLSSSVHLYPPTPLHTSLHSSPTPLLSPYLPHFSPHLSLHLFPHLAPHLIPHLSLYAPCRHRCRRCTASEALQCGWLLSQDSQPQHVPPALELRPRPPASAVPTFRVQLAAAAPTQSQNQSQPPSQHRSPLAFSSASGQLGHVAEARRFPAVSCSHVAAMPSTAIRVARELRRARMLLNLT